MDYKYHTKTTIKNKILVKYTSKIRLLIKISKMKKDIKM